MTKSQKEEAKVLLSARMKEVRKRSFPELVRLIDDADTVEVTGHAGKEYQIEINAFWDDKAKTALRVSGTIDDGGLRAYINWGSLLQDFLVCPDGKTQ